MKQGLKITLSAIILTASLTFSALAYFNSQATIKNNKLATGDVEIQAFGYGWLGPVNTNNIKPNDHIYKLAVIRNVGTLPTKIFLQASKTNGDQELYDALKVKVIVLKNGQPENEVFNGLLKNLLTQIDTNQTIAPNENAVFQFDFWLPDDGTDQSNLEKKSTTFDLIFQGR